jgi:FMN phosphatase YigB (HAD superfamily)
VPKIKAIICDLDGTLCDFEHRRHLFKPDPKEWDAFHDAMMDDAPNWNVASVVALHLEFQYRVIFVTGRFERFRKATVAWLDEHLPAFNRCPILMRDDGDHRSDQDIKEEIYKAFIEPIYDVKLVLEDRSHVVEMWRRNGMECWQVARGDY